MRRGQSTGYNSYKLVLRSLKTQKAGVERRQKQRAMVEPLIIVTKRKKGNALRHVGPLESVALAVILAKLAATKRLFYLY